MNFLKKGISSKFMHKNSALPLETFFVSSNFMHKNDAPSLEYLGITFKSSKIIIFFVSALFLYTLISRNLKYEFKSQ